MFVFLLQVRHAVVEGGPLYLFAVFSAIVWALWVVKIVLSRRYEPWREPYETTTSVLVPVVDEPVDLFRDVLRRIVAQRPTETIVVINGARNHALEEVCAEFADDGVVWTWTPIPSKRNAVKVGTELASGEILVLVDSDTVWTRDTLCELVKPFADPGIGGVTTRQRVLDPQRHFFTRWADWLENSRVKYSMPAQSVLGHVGCLPGRTIAFRRQIVVKAMDEFMHGRFLGVFLEISDDRTLTNLALKQGYRTVYQSTSLVFTDAPVTVRKLYKQQLRWARGSQYNTLRMLPWMVRRAPVLAVFFVSDIVLPFLLLGAVIGGVERAVHGTGVNYYTAYLREYGFGLGMGAVVVLTVLASGLSMAIRQLRHLEEVPGDWWRMPAFVLFSSMFLMPIRLIGFFRMAHVAAWGTRRDAYSGMQDDVIAELERETAPAPTDIVDRDAPTPSGAAAHTAALAAPVTAGTQVREHPEEADLRPKDGGRHAVNVLAAVPYLIGGTLIVLEVLYRG